MTIPKTYMPKPTPKPKELKYIPLEVEASLPPVTKTEDMNVLEGEHGADVRLIIKGAIEAHGTQRAAAKSLKISESMLAHWLPRLRMRVEMKPVVIIEA